MVMRLFFFSKNRSQKETGMLLKKNFKIGTSPAIGLLPNAGCLLFLHAAGFVIAVLTGTSHLLYVKRSLYGFKFLFFLCVCSVPFSWRQMIISSFKVYSFLKALPIAVVGDFLILKNSAQLNKIGCWDRKTEGYIQFLHVSDTDAQSSPHSILHVRLFSYRGLLT